MVTDVVNILLYFLLFVWVVIIPSLQYFLFNKENGSYIEYITDIKEYNLLTKLVYFLFYFPTLLLIFIGSIINKIGRSSFLVQFLFLGAIITIFSTLNVLITEKHADFKNEELSHNIIKNNLDKLENISYIDIHNLVLFDDGKENDEETYASVLVPPNKKEYKFGRLKECKILLRVDTSKALFREDDINKLGIDGVYEAANICINEVYDILKKENKIK